MAEDPLVQAMETFTLVGVLVAFLIFTRLAVKAKSLGSFRFQLSIFILIWVVAELPHIAGTLGLISIGGYETFGLAFHMLSMTAFALFVGARSYNLLRMRTIAPPLPSTQQVLPKPQEGIRP